MTANFKTESLGIASLKIPHKIAGSLSYFLFDGQPQWIEDAQVYVYSMSRDETPNVLSKSHFVGPSVLGGFQVKFSEESIKWRTLRG